MQIDLQANRYLTHFLLSILDKLCNSILSLVKLTLKRPEPNNLEQWMPKKAY